MRPDLPIIEACAEGLSRWRRTRKGGTHAAVTFAELVVDGFPVDTDGAWEALQAHHLLDEAPSTEATAISRLLWGGGQATSWLSALLPPVAAELQPDWLDRLNKQADQIDERLYDQIIGAIEAAQRSAQRSIGARLANQIKRTPAPVLAELGPVDLDAGRPYRTWETVPAPMRAEANIDVLAAVQASADDLGDVVEQLVAEAEADVDEAVENAAQVPIPPEPSLAPVAAAAAVGLFADWMLSKYTTDDPTDVDEQLDTTDKMADPSTFIAASIVAVASGAGSPDGRVLRDDYGQPVDAQGTPTGGRSAAARLLRRMAHPAIRAVRRLGLETVRPVQQFEWVYGPVSERQRPYEPHLRLDGKTWTADDPGAALKVEPDGSTTPSFRGHYVGDHYGCKCRPPKPTILLESI